MLKKMLIALGVSFMMVGSANAALKSYDISWIGPNNYSLSGQFTFDDATAGSDVDQTELTSFFIEGFLNGNSLGSYSGPVHTFNFNADTGVLSSNQVWNMTIWGSTATGFGFGSGRYAQGIVQDGEIYQDSRLELAQFGNALTATITPSVVPLPAAAWMFIAGLAALFGGKWRLKRKALVAA